MNDNLTELIPEAAPLLEKILPDKVSPQQIETVLLQLVSESGCDKTICPSEAAISIAGKHGDAWGALMPAVRKIAVRLANEGRIVVMRKGKPVDPNDFKGVYRLGMTRID